MEHVNELPSKLSSEFSKLIRKTLGKRKLQQVIELNYRYQGQFCATHEFIDANMVMFQAWKNIFKNADVKYFNVNDQSNVDLWNAAWNMSMKADFKN